MTTDHAHPSPQQAREQLSRGLATSLDSRDDRRTHALGTVVLGLTVGCFFCLQVLVTGRGGVALSCLFVAVCAAEAVWVERRARTVPRRARTWSRLGFGVSILAALTVALPWLNWQAQSAPVGWPPVLVAALGVAVPSLVAAAVIARGRP